MNMLRKFLLIPVLVALVSCSGLQPMDQDFLLDQAVIRSLDKDGQERADMWDKVATGLEVLSAEGPDEAGAMKDVVANLVEKVSRDQDLNLADQRALGYLVKRLLPADIGAGEILTKEQRMQIARAAYTIRDALSYWQEYHKAE